MFGTSLVALECALLHWHGNKHASMCTCRLGLKMCICLHSLQLHLLGFDMCGVLDVRRGCLHLGVQPDRLLTMLRLRVMLPSIHS